MGRAAPRRPAPAAAAPHTPVMSEKENPAAVPALVPPATPPAPAPLVDLVLDGLSSEHSRRAYRRALGDFFGWYQSNATGEGFTRAVVQRYRSHLGERGLSAASINLALAAIRKLATEAASNELLSPVAAAAILRVGGARRTGIPDRQLADAAPGPAAPRNPRPGNGERPARPRAAGAARGLGAAERYLGLRQNLHDAPCDRLGIRGWEG